MRATLILLLSAALVSIAAIGCDVVEERISPSTPTQVSPTRTIPPEPQETRDTPGISPAAPGLVLPVSIAVVPPDLPKYDRSSWRHWTDEDKDCQNARQEVLIAESAVAVTYEPDDRCRVATGLWEGPYTGKSVNYPSDLDVDHMVPLENAHRSGAWSWSRERKREYANHLEYENHLIATTSGANRSKGSKGPERWRPPLEDYWCVYAIDWVTIKNDWGLSVTEAEYSALFEMLATCEMTVLLQPKQGAPAPPPTSTITPSLPTDLRYDPFGPDRDCGDFDSYGDALAFFLAAGGPEVDPHRLDVNSNGEPCESLPGGPAASELPTSPEGASAVFSQDEPPIGRENGGCPATGPPRTARNYLPASLVGGQAATDCIATPPPTTSPVLLPPIIPTPMPAPTATLTPMPTPSAIPAAGLDPVPEETFVDMNCGDFSDWQAAQAFYLSEGGPSRDPHRLDRNLDGVACQSLPGAPHSVSGTKEPAATSTPLPTLTAEPEPAPALAASTDLPFDPDGPDRDCGEFSSWWHAQNFYLAAGGPDEDPHGLDQNGDGTACESLSGVPGSSLENSAAATGPPDDFEDHNCSDFESWGQAQDFYISEGGPSEDRHRMDGDKDGIACEGLWDAPRNRN